MYIMYIAVRTQTQQTLEYGTGFYYFNTLRRRESLCLAKTALPTPSRWIGVGVRMVGL